MYKTRQQTFQIRSLGFFFFAMAINLGCGSPEPPKTKPDRDMTQNESEMSEMDSSDMVQDVNGSKDISSDLRSDKDMELDVLEDMKLDLQEDMESDPTRVKITDGPLRGVLEDEVIAFKGIPYAAPPVGALRFTPPSKVAPWSAELDATSWPPRCTQLDQKTQSVVGEEDCLYLNVWKPQAADKAPVIVFIHGGGNMFGSTSEQGSGVYTYEGKELARRTGAVVVTLQYRLNIMGYISTLALDEEFGKTSGNWGLRDQVAALTWVQDNIERFGGLPSKVMLFGESGGAASVCGLIATPEAKGLFHSAIMQSGGCGAHRLEKVRDWSTTVVERVGCKDESDVMACLRAKSAGELARVSSEQGTANQGAIQLATGPMIDGVVLPNSPMVMMQQGTHNKMPIVFGVNAHETASPLFGIIGRMWTKAQYEQRVRELFGSKADAVLNEYSVGLGGAFRLPIEALIALTTDAQFICPNRRFARAASSGQQEPVYRFLFEHSIASGAASALGAFHGLELIYNFQHMSNLENYTPTQDDLYVEEVMRTLWFDFAAMNKPSTHDGVTWPVYRLQSDDYLSIASPIVAKQGMRTQRCDFLESL